MEEEYWQIKQVMRINFHQTDIKRNQPQSFGGFFAEKELESGVIFLGHNLCRKYFIDSFILDALKIIWFRSEIVRE